MLDTPHRLGPPSARTRASGSGCESVAPARRGSDTEDAVIIFVIEAATLTAPFRLPAAPAEADLLTKYFPAWVLEAPRRNGRA
jgi:hypothetical protein